MSKFYTLFISLGMLLMTMPSDSWAQCPSLLEYEVEYDQFQEGKNGILTFVMGNNNASPLNLDDFEFNLWDKNRGVYLYTPSKLDAGFHVDKNIKVTVEPSGKVKFLNVPPGSSYCLVISSQGCQKVFGPEEGIVVEPNKRGK
ncbi:hypothetical protein PZB74_02685 [Porifericola rhodea]|uniref:hypothetical protein n=1 Tax=Porifericola rhodea TaxID=930972 RepID=UPI002666911F|nr:hypothetical protein [Porifericola rhodea]WKN32258.1 hypothetical protein PZB74_02685 [Porifericola rhodea]